jgi:hypothetical protein
MKCIKISKRSCLQQKNSAAFPEKIKLKTVDIRLQFLDSGVEKKYADRRFYRFCLAPSAALVYITYFSKQVPVCSAAQG